MLQLNLLDTRSADFQAQLAPLLAFEATQDESIERIAADILAQVRRRGDEAVLEYTRRFDRVHCRADLRAGGQPRRDGSRLRRARSGAS